MLIATSCKTKIEELIHLAVGSQISNIYVSKFAPNCVLDYLGWSRWQVDNDLISSSSIYYSTGVAPTITDEKWTSIEVNGSVGFCLKVRMNKLKTHLKNWNKVSFGNVDNTITELENKVEDFDLIGNLRDLTEEECTAKRNTVQLLWIASRQREFLWRSHRNHITGITVNGSWVSHPHEVRRATFEYFKDLFDCDQWARPAFPGLQFKKLCRQQAFNLEAPITMEELKATIWSCDGSKAPRPSSFNFNFIKSSWTFIKKDLFDFISNFMFARKLEKSLNSSFIALIPKVQSPSSLSEYRSISLVNSLYKILTNRFKAVISSVVSDSQNAFISDYQITDEIMLASEVIHSMCKNLHNESGIVLKLDFKKAFDHMD
ncbi:Reverse transcriptase domain - like 10 [Theobroma cacao]|nr:Reverse transcriptase domain - like 10 [Theobroma cacao]